MTLQRLAAIAVLVLPTALAAQTTAVGNWRAEFVGPMGPRPQMVDTITFTFQTTSTGLAGTAKTEPEWPGELDVSDIKLEGNKLSFVGTGRRGWTANSIYHCCPRLVFAGTIDGDQMKLTMTWTSTENPDNPSAQPVPMEARRLSREPR